MAGRYLYCCFIAENSDPIPISFEVENGDNWTLVLVEVLPIANFPTASAVSLAAGYVGTPVTITGTFLNGATAVDFGGTLASFTVVSSTEITCLAR